MTDYLWCRLSGREGADGKGGDMDAWSGSCRHTEEMR